MSRAPRPHGRISTLLPASIRAPPHPARLGRGHEQLETVFAGITRARNCRAHRGDFTRGEPIVLDACQVHGRQLLRDVRGFGALDCNQGIACAGVHEGDVAALCGRLTLDPGPGLCHVSCVDDEQVVLVRQPINQHVVDKCAFRCRERGVLRLADGEPRGIVGRDPLDERKGVGAGHLNLTHVADVEESRAGSNGHVLVGDAGVLDGHVPPGELDHASATGDVNRVKRRLTQFGWSA